MSTYPLVPLAGVATVRSGYAFKSSDWTESGVPVLKIANIHPGLVDLAGCGFVDEATAAKAQSFTVERDDSLIAMSGASVGKVGRVRFSERALVNQRVGRFSVLDPAKLDADFLYYSLQLPATVDYLTGSAYGSAQPNISPSLILNAEIPLPSLSEQKSITDLLCSLDDKIAANREHMRTIDEFLSALFKSISSHASVKSLQEVATVNPSTVTPDSEGTLRYIDISSVGRGYFEYPDVSSWKDAPSRARRHVQSADIIWSTVRPSRQSHALILENDELLVASTGLAVIRPQDKSFAYLYEATKVSMFSSYLESVAEGSAYPAVRAELFGMAPILWALDSDRSFFESVAAPLRYRAQTLISENRVLAATRDALLAPLMSGKLRVREAEEVVEDVL